jgi:hypothetical protein
MLILQESDVKILCAKAREILGMLRLGIVGNSYSFLVGRHIYGPVS